MNNIITNPNANYGDQDYEESAYYWLQFSDMYMFKEIIYFDSWLHLLQLIVSIDLKKVHYAMIEENQRQKKEIAKAWDELLTKAVKHRNRRRLEKRWCLTKENVDYQITLWICLITNFKKMIKWDIVSIIKFVDFEMRNDHDDGTEISAHSHEGVDLVVGNLKGIFLVIVHHI